MLQEEVGVILLGGALILSAGAGALAAGVPLLLLPAPLIGAAYLALYYRSGLLRDYLLFVGCTVITCAWFLYHHFWFLEVRSRWFLYHNVWFLGFPNGHRRPGLPCLAGPTHAGWYRRGESAQAWR